MYNNVININNIDLDHIFLLRQDFKQGKALVFI